MPELSGGEYIALLEARRAAVEVARPVGPRVRGWAGLAAPLERFVQPGDDRLFTPPPAAPREVSRRVRAPRTYRSATSLREERDLVQARLDALTPAQRSALRTVADGHVERVTARGGSHWETDRARAAGLPYERLTDLGLIRPGRLSRRVGSMEWRTTHLTTEGLRVLDEIGGRS